MPKLTFPDGSVREFPAGATGAEVAASISKSLSKAALAVALDGKPWDLKRPIPRDAKIRILTAKDPEALEIVRHDAAHVLAQAVQALFPGTQVTIGPVIEDGFFYDFARKEPFSTDDFAKIEAKMAEIVDADHPIEREEWDRNDAIAHFKKLGEAYKAEIIEDLPKDDVISLYRQGPWMDLCIGPHLPSTGKLPKAFKLMKLAGAYWRGDHRNEMLQRIYGTAWLNKADLDAYLLRLEEAEKRDHRKLARVMDLFHLQPEAQGSVFWHPQGFRVWRALEAYIRRRQDESGYLEVKTPQLLDSKLWEQSGHWAKFRENMFVVPDEVPSTEEGKPILSGEGPLLALKPMNCPAHVQIFNNEQRSYRELPLRFSEFGCCHRNESHGSLHGVLRVRQMTQDDGHIFCREDQIAEETRRFLELFATVYGDFGLSDIAYKLATRPPVRAGDDATWDRAEMALASALDATGLKYELAEGEGAFYGPKLEFHLTDAIGRTWQCGTYQLDYVLPERLGAEYTGSDGAKHRPVMLHRAVFGTFERFIGILIEHTAGAFPLWLAPTQVVVATITSDADGYATAAAERLRAAGLWVETDLRNEKINFKVREHSERKVPVIAVVGRQEAEARTLALRRFGEGQQRQEILALEAAARALADEATPPDLKRAAAARAAAE
jgi:threonyl-tRNA synthetase